MLANLLLLIVFFITLALVVTALAHIWVAVPFIPTPSKVITTMIDAADLQPGDTMYDLGAGDARALILAKKKHPDIKAIGIEFVPTVWLLGKLRIWCSGQQVELRMKDALKCDVSDADVIFLYLIPGMMKKLEQQFDAQLKPGTKVLSYAFSFKDREPVTEKVVPWLSGERKLRVYEW